MVAFFNSIYFLLKTFDKHTFFKHTYSEFTLVDYNLVPEKVHFTSKYRSSYYFTKEGVYRKANHWGRVANCRWKLNSDKKLKNQSYNVGFAKWVDFYPLNEIEKLFFISINYNERTVKLQPKNKISTDYLFTFPEAQKRIKKIKHLFKDEKWATYFDDSIDSIRFKIISEYINSDKSIQQIKVNLK